MSLFSAKQLCPELILNPVDKAYYEQVSQKVMRLLEEYVDVLEQTSIDEAYLDCTKKIAENSTITIEGCCKNQRCNKAAMRTVIIYRSSFYKVNCENSLRFQET
jgi:nucleotidyltransferase/DNA polymerase involved in DNA repair